MALAVTGCGFARPDVDWSQDLINNDDCAPDEFVVGLLSERGFLELQAGGRRSVIWPGTYKISWVSSFLAGHFEVRDENGIVVATTGRRYRMGGMNFIGAGNAFWACGPITPT